MRVVFYPNDKTVGVRETLKFTTKSALQRVSVKKKLKRFIEGSLTQKSITSAATFHGDFQKGAFLIYEGQGPENWHRPLIPNAFSLHFLEVMSLPPSNPLVPLLFSSLVSSCFAPSLPVLPPRCDPSRSQHRETWRKMRVVTYCILIVTCYPVIGELDSGVVLHQL